MERKLDAQVERGGSMHLIDQNVILWGSSAIVGNSIPIGVGLALSSN